MGRELTPVDDTAENQQPESDNSDESLPPLESDNSSDWWENTDTIRAKWMYDGCKTIDEMISRLHGEIARLLELKNEGWELIEEVNDDYGHIKKQEQNNTNN